MDICKYLNEKKKLYDILLQYIDSNDDNIQTLLATINDQKIIQSKDEVTFILHLLVSIFDNHHRSPDLKQKIEQILQYFLEFIKYSYEDDELFDILKSNKLMTLFFIKQQILKINKDIADKIVSIGKKRKSYGYHHFFYPEIKEFLSKKDQKEFERYDPNFFLYFENKRKIGENDSEICQIIRTDSINEFINYIKPNEINNKTIYSSIFETNQFLIQNNPTYIEYAAFFGSIKIFQYLRNNKADINQSIWLYAIHGRNEEIIHCLENDNIQPPNFLYKNCISNSIKYRYQFLKTVEINRSSNICSALFFMDRNFIISWFEDSNQDPNDSYYILADECIKCHHNELALYFQNNYLKEDKKDYKMVFKSYNIDCIAASLLQKEKSYHNYFYYYLNRYDYTILKKLFLNSNLYLKNVTGTPYVVIPDDITVIDKNLISKYGSMFKVWIPRSVKSIGDYAFENSIFLDSVKIPPSVKSIGKHAFDNCKLLTKVKIPSSVKSIGDYTFQNCSSLSHVEIPKSVTKILHGHTFKDSMYEYSYKPDLHTRGDFHFCFIIIFYSIFGILFASMIIVFSIQIIWWLRIHPWFAHGYNSGKTVYLSTEISWISFAVAFAFLLLYLLYYFLIHLCSGTIIIRNQIEYFNKLNYVSNIIAYSIIMALFLIAIISSMIASSYALKNEKIDGESIKCLRYVFNGFNGASDWVANMSLKKKNDLEKWHSNMLNKAYKNNGKVTNYYCNDVGASSLTFAILALLSWLLNLIVFKMGKCDLYIPILNLDMD